MKFLALGGTNETGASCYYLELAGKHILLDCGKGLQNGLTSHGPDFSSLLGPKGPLPSLSDIDAVFISHAHYDHIAHLPDLAGQCRETPIYATKITKEIGKHLMWDRMNFMHKNRLDAEIDETLLRIREAGYLKEIDLGGIKVFFYEAGHIPGAAMIYFESGDGNVLYTGDFMERGSYLTSGYKLPDQIEPETVIMCALHGKHPLYSAKNSLEEDMGEIAGLMNSGKPVYIIVQHMTKGIETVHVVLEEMNKRRLPERPIFVDDSIWLLSERLSASRLPSLSGSCRRFPRKIGGKNLPYGSIFIGSLANSRFFANIFEANISLHAEYRECVALLRKFAPKKLFVLHSPPDVHGYGNEALKNDFPKIDVIYPEKGLMYC